MNKHGQTLVLFIICIPLLLILAAFTVDIGLSTKENSRLKNTSKIIMKEVYSKYNDETSLENAIKDLFQKNEISIENLIVLIDNDRITIQNSYKIDSIFGKLVNIKDYRIQTSVTGYLENNQLIIKEN